jgi:hypothetical protein
MKNKILIAILLISTAITFAGASIIKFSAKSQSDGSISIFWQATIETNLKHYEIERRTVNGGFGWIATIEPEADKNYEYIDNNAYKSSASVYSYRLRIVDNDGSVSYTEEFPVRHNVSSVKRTWGSIKALFR